jgi:hypothetical protein
MNAEPRCYTLRELLPRLGMTPRTFRRLRAAGALPFLEELRPRLGRIVRYRAEPIDRYLAGHWAGPRLLLGRRRA